MSKVICGVTVSLDGFMAGDNMTLENPFGDIPTNLLTQWIFDEHEENKAEIDALVSVGAYIMGRNMFGPKNLQQDLAWKGWWDEIPLTTRQCLCCRIACAS